MTSGARTRFAAALSKHPVAADAVGEILGTVVEAGGTRPDLAVLFLSPAHAQFASEIASAVRVVLDPAVLLGTTTTTVIGGAHEAEDGAAVSLWASWAGPVEPVRLRSEPSSPSEMGGIGDAASGERGVTISGMPSDLAEGATLLLLADPFSIPADGLVDQLAAMRPDVAVVGGLCSGGDRPGESILIVDDEIHHGGAIGAVIPRDQLVGPVVSQGCRPIGEPLVVTAAERNFIHELAGRAALERLEELVESISAEERALLASGIHLGIVIDERRDQFDRGDFLVRAVLGGDKERGVLAVGDQVPVGTTVQFHVRDAASADEDLHHLLEGVHGGGALVFSCTGRGSALFGTPDHDAAAVADAVRTDAVAGMFCAGELGPVGGRSFLHSFTASVLVFAAGSEHPVAL